MVGVVVPVHGFAPFLAEALDAVLAQDPAPGAVVVVDDGSRRALELLPEHAERCRLVRRERRGGPAAARATGAEALGAGCELVALCDADDAWEPGKLALQLAAMEREPEAALCWCRAVVVGVDGRRTGEVWPAGTIDGELLYTANPICTSGVVLRRAALEAAKGFSSSDLQVAEDWDLWLRLWGMGERFVAEDRAVVRYRRHPGALTTDVAGLARAQLLLHERHAEQVSPFVRSRTRRADLVALADGLARERRWAEARAALDEADRRPLRRALLSVPVARGLVGRRDPYAG